MTPSERPMKWVCLHRKSPFCSACQLMHFCHSYPNLATYTYHRSILLRTATTHAVSIPNASACQSLSDRATFILVCHTTTNFSVANQSPSHVLAVLQKQNPPLQGFFNGTMTLSVKCNFTCLFTHYAEQIHA